MKYQYKGEPSSYKGAKICRTELEARNLARKFATDSNIVCMNAETYYDLQAKEKQHEPPAAWPIQPDDYYDSELNRDATIGHYIREKARIEESSWWWQK